MQRLIGKRKLLPRLVLALLPACALPLFAFGYVSIRSHYESLRTQSLQGHKTLVTFMGRQLDNDVGRALHLIQTASKAEVFKTRNLFLIRENLASIREMGGEIAQVAFLDPEARVLAMEPQAPAFEGKYIEDSFPEKDKKKLTETFKEFDDNGTSVTPVFADDLSVVRFRIMQRVFAPDGETTAHLFAEVALASWTQLSRSILKNHASMLGVVVQNAKGFDQSIRLSDDGDSQFWGKVAEIRSLESEATEQEIGGEPHHVMFLDVDPVKSRLAVAQPLSAIYASPRQILFTYAGFMVVLFLLLGVAILLLAKGITGPIKRVADAATAFAEGNFEVRAVVKGQDELAVLADTFNRMGASLEMSHQRMRVLYKSIMELFACNDADGILRKAVELACTQCQGEAAWFLPEKAGREIAYADDAVFIGLHGWAWKNHRSVEIDAKEAGAIWRRVEGDRVFPFMMKSQNAVIGVLKVAYRTAPDEHMVSLLHSLISLVEMALAKQDQIKKGAMVSTELGMAEAVQRNIMSENLLVSRSSRLSYHYQPASRLGGDWFYLIEDKQLDRLHVVMGDVTGHGLAQGLVTTAVKGALDVIEHLLERPDKGGITGPADIVNLLETVVWRVAGPVQLTMTCLSAVVDFAKEEIRVCNAGHTFPILVRHEGGGNSATHLSKNQQPLLGPSRDHRYEETVYPLKKNDMLVIYTDGLTDVKSLKSGVFGRFLFRGLKKGQEYANAEVLKDEILEMFRYYTQETKIDDDVCFLVVQVRAAERSLERSA